MKGCNEKNRQRQQRKNVAIERRVKTKTGGGVTENSKKEKKVICFYQDSLHEVEVEPQRGNSEEWLKTEWNRR